MARTVIDELITLLGFDLKPNSLPLIDQFSQRLEKVEKLALWATAGLTGAAAAAFAFVQSGAKGAAELQRFQNLTGISAQKVQSFAGAIKLAGGNSEGLQETLSNLNSVLNPLLPGEFNQSMFQFFGGNASFMRAKDAVSLLDMINTRMQSIGTQERKFEWAKRLGLDPGTAQLVTASRKQYLAFRKEIESFPLILSEKQTKSALDFEIQLTKVGMAFDFFKSEASTAITPILREWLEGLVGFIKNNPNLRKDFEDIFKGVAKGAGEAGSNIKEMVKHISDIIPGLDKWWEGMNKVQKAAEATKLAIEGALALIVAGMIVKTFGIQGVAVLGALGLVGGAGHYLGKAGDWVAQKLTGDKSNSLGGMAYDLTHGGGQTSKGIGTLSGRFDEWSRRIDQHLSEIEVGQFFAANPWMGGMNSGGLPGYLRAATQTPGPITININGAGNPRATANTVIEKLGGYNYFPNSMK